MTFENFMVKGESVGNGWSLVLRFNATLTAEVISWWSLTHMFPGFLTPVLTQLFFPKPQTTFLACFCGGERRKYAGKKARLSRGSNSQSQGHESDTLTTEPLGRGGPCLTHYQTTNFRLFQTERVCGRQFQIGRKWQQVI